MRRWLGCAALAVGLMAPASAQSLYGPEGLFLHPTASVPPAGRLTPGFLVLPQYNPEVKETRTWLSGFLDYGVTDDLEIGFAAVKVFDWERDASFGGFAKYRLVRETTTRPAFAVGFTGLGGGDVDTRIAFAAARKQFGIGQNRFLVVHAGVQYVVLVDGNERDEFEPFAGVELGLTTRLSFIVEGRPRQRHDFGTPLALTLAYRVSDRWRLAVSWANNGLSDQPMFGFGAGLSLGSR
jgi:hypothetical protein